MDLIDRQAAIDALWKALYEYEDKTEKQFIESEELDVGDWFLHRIFVQNMSDIDIQTILNLPSAHRPADEWCTDCKEYDHDKHCCPRFNRVIRSAVDEQKHGRWIDLRQEGDSRFMCSVCKWKEHVPTCMGKPTVWEYCPSCGARMDGDDNG